MENIERAVERLKAGNATQLRKDTRAVAKYLAELVPTGINLPRGYYTTTIQNLPVFLKLGLRQGDCDFFIEGDDKIWPKPPRKIVLEFARDIQGGLLSEIEAMLKN